MPYTHRSGVRIHYRVEGNRQRPPLVMIHGNGNCLDDWYPLGFVKHLSAYFYLILIDMRGYGASEKPTVPSAYTADCVASDVIAVLDELGIDKCHYYGNSRGGSIAFIVAKRYPARFLSYFIAGAEPFASAAPQYASQNIELFQQGMSNCIAIWESSGDLFPPAVKESFLRNDPVALIAANRAQLEWPNDSDCFLHPPLAVPRTLMYGGLDEFISISQRYLQLDPQCEWIILEGLTHAQAYWNSERISPEIIRFIMKHST